MNAPANTEWVELQAWRAPTPNTASDQPCNLHLGVVVACSPVEHLHWGSSCRRCRCCRQNRCRNRRRCCGAWLPPAAAHACINPRRACRICRREAWCLGRRWQGASNSLTTHSARSVASDTGTAGASAAQEGKKRHVRICNTGRFVAQAWRREHRCESGRNM